MGILGGNAKLTLGDGGNLTLRDGGIAAVGVQGGLGNALLEDAVDCNLLMKCSDNCFKAVAVSFLSLKGAMQKGIVKRL